MWGLLAQVDAAEMQRVIETLVDEFTLNNQVVALVATIIALMVLFAVWWETRKVERRLKALERVDLDSESLLEIRADSVPILRLTLRDLVLMAKFQERPFQIIETDDGPKLVQFNKLENVEDSRR